MGTNERQRRRWLLVVCGAGIAAVVAGAGLFVPKLFNRENLVTKTPKEECEALMAALVPLAEKTLADKGEFFPFGGTMLPDGKIEIVAAYDGDEHPPSQRLIDMMVERFRAGAKQNKYKATAIVYDVKVVPPEATEKSDAISVRLDHVTGYSVQVLLPYRFGPGRALLFGTTFAAAGPGSVFGAP